jgi:uncharacterized protein YndB with AHSA1/START domain
MSTQQGSTSRSSTVIERTFRARVKKLWGLWTTKEGFESWWGAEGSRVQVHTIEAREGGALRYDMIAVDFYPAGDSVRMVITIEPLHNEEFTQTSIRVFTSQLSMLEGRFQGR